LLALEGQNANEILGFPDDLKFRSSITLFAAVAPKIAVFKSLIAKYFNGLPDQKAIEIISSLLHRQQVGHPSTDSPTDNRNDSLSVGAIRTA
jgi:hypothetical protein